MYHLVQQGQEQRYLQHPRSKVHWEYENLDPKRSRKKKTENSNQTLSR